jgi:hypothetical protein
MASNDDLGKLSPEQLKQFNRAVADMKSLPGQQEAILEKILAGEIEIGNTRIAALERYFDMYSKKLDLVARKHTSLDDSFLLLGKNLSDEYKSLVADLEALSTQVDRTGFATTSSGTKADSSKKVFTTQEIEKRQKLEKESLTTLEDLRKEHLLKIRRLNEDYKENELQLELASSKKKLDIQLRSEEFRIRELTAIQQAELKAQNLSNELDYQIESTSTKAGAKIHGDSRVQLLEAEEREKSLQELKKQLDTKRAQLEFEARGRNNGKLLKKDAAAIEKQLSEEFAKRKRNLDELTAERFEKERMLAEDGLKNAFEKKRIERKRELELKALQANNGILTKDTLLAINEQVNTEFQLRSDKSKKLLAELGALRLAEAELAALKENDPKLVEEFEKKRAERRRELELKALQANNGILTKEALLAINEQIDTEFQLRSDKGKQLLEELGAIRLAEAELAALKENDPKLVEEFEKKRAERKRQLELAAALRNNGIITEEERKSIKQILDAEFIDRSNLLKKLQEERLADVKLESADTLLTKLKEEDPGLAVAREAKIKQRIADLEYEYRQAHNNELNEEARKEIEYQAKLEYLTNSATIGKLTEEYKDQVKLDRIKETDPSLGAEVDKDIADRKARLIYEAMSNTNRQLQAEELADIEAQARAEALAEDNIKKLSTKVQSNEQKELIGKDDPSLASKLEAQRAIELADFELKLRKANNGLLDKDAKEKLKALADKEYDLSDKNLNKLGKKRQKELEKEKKARLAETDRTIARAVDFSSLSKEDNLLDRIKDVKALTDQVEGPRKADATLLVAAKMLSSIAKQLENTVDKIASYQGDIDTRLQGSNNKTNYAGSYWGQLTKDMMSVGAVTPFFKQEKFAENIKSLVEKGISFDLKQRAFLMTIQEKIANTFNVADGTLLRLVRIQQEDSTAGRLGMESALNSFLNEMYETSEYLTDVAASVRGSLEEMEALMGGAEATEVEYQVQKWMGSLYSVGMSQNAVTTISNALGQIAAGQVEALTGDGAGNLLIMAANNAGIPIADILSKGLDADKTNQLLQATVNYLAEIAESSKDNQVVQQQLAGVFGVKASDLKAATNLKTSKDGKYSIPSIFSNFRTYDNMLTQLNDMAGSMIARTSVGEIMTNIWENGQYTLASSMASSPIAYLTYKMASLLEDTTGGISLPFISAFGSGVDLNTTVADLMRVASISGGILGSIGPMISGLASSFSGRAMLSKMGIGTDSGLTVTPRGDGGSSAGIGGGGMTGGGAETTSGSGYVGNGSGSDVKNSTIQEAEDNKKKLMIEAKEEEENAPVNIINMNVLKIYELLDDVAHGRSSFSVKIDGYGLTKTNSTNSLTGAQGGVAGLLSNNGANNGTLSGGFNAGGGSTGGYSGSSGGSSSSSSGGSGASNGAGAAGSGSTSSNAGFGVGPSVDLGGWIMT